MAQVLELPKARGSRHSPRLLAGLFGERPAVDARGDAFQGNLRSLKIGTPRKG